MKSEEEGGTVGRGDGARPSLGIIFEEIVCRNMTDRRTDGQMDGQFGIWTLSKLEGIKAHGQ